VVAELLALVDIGDVYLDDGSLQRTDAVVQGYRGVGVGSGIEHDAVVRKTYLLHLVDEFTLNVALEILDVHIGIFGLQLGQILLERRTAIDAWLTGAEQVKVGTIND
jgi:hypothetical protein